MPALRGVQSPGPVVLQPLSRLGAVGMHAQTLSSVRIDYRQNPEPSSGRSSLTKSMLQRWFGKLASGSVIRNCAALLTLFFVPTCSVSSR